MKLYCPITIDLYRVYPLQVMEAQQGNVGRGAIVTLTAGSAVIDPTDETVEVYAKKPDGTVSWLECSVEDAKVKINFTNQMLMSPGILQVELRMKDDEDDITTPIFKVKVNKSNVQSAGRSENELPLLDQIKKNAEDAKTAAEAAETAVGNKVTNPAIGAVGQILEIETVDDEGKPLTYKAVEKPESGVDKELSQIIHASKYGMVSDGFSDTVIVIGKDAAAGDVIKYVIEENSGDITVIYDNNDTGEFNITTIDHAGEAAGEKTLTAEKYCTYTFPSEMDVYLPFNIPTKTSQLTDDVGFAKQEEVGKLSEEIVNLQEGKSDVFFEKDYGNLYNYATDSEINWAIHPDNGELYSASGYRATDFIEVLPNKTLFTNMNSYGAFYDKNKNFISCKQFGLTQIKIPYNAKYYRGSVIGEKRLSSWVAYYDMTDNFKKYGEGLSFNITDAMFLEWLDAHYKKVTEDTRSYIGKKIAVIGDSWSDPNNGSCTKNWHTWISEITGATVQCVAKSGTGYKRGSDDGNLYNTFASQALVIDSDTDLVILFGSGNDCGTGNNSNFTFGTARDTTNETVGGCMNITLDNIQSTAPNARILMVSPAPWINFDPWWISEANGRMDVYTDLMSEVAKARGVRFKDMYHSSDMHPQNEVFKATYYNADGVHPNDNGQKRLYPDILAEVVAILPITVV